jgi:hypothetical protein
LVRRCVPLQSPSSNWPAAEGTDPNSHHNEGRRAAELLMNNTGVEDGRRTVAADGIAAGTRRLRSQRGRQKPISSFL